MKKGLKELGNCEGVLEEAHALFLKPFKAYSSMIYRQRNTHNFLYRQEIPALSLHLK